MQTKAAKWTRIIGEQRRSGLAVTEFCRRRRIAKATFWWWRKRLAGVAQPAMVAPPAHFLALPLVAPATEHVEVDLGSLRVRLGGAAAMRVVDAIVARMGDGGQR